MNFQFNDGGREAAGYKGKTGDCVCRSIAIATGRPYKEIYERLAKGNASQRSSKNDRRSKTTHKKETAAHGIFVTRQWFKDYMKELGFEWIATMQIGQGCKVHLNENELPKGRLVVSVSRHYTAVIDGVINDTYNPADRGATVYGLGYSDLPKGAKLMENGNGYVYNPERCVYGYWKLKN